MADGKKYQVFVSSTFSDLQNERRAVMTALMEAGYIPAGMEFFGAVDEKQFEFIKRVIDDSDYYVVIVGNRYGSLDKDGMSYTEKEYDYAVSKAIKVIALVHGEPAKLPQQHSEKKPRLQKRLELFRKKLLSDRVVSLWTDPAVLSKDAVVAMSRHVNLFPAMGWVRASHLASVETLAEMNELRKKVAELEAKLAADQALPFPEDIAQLDESFVVSGTWGPLKSPWTCSVTWAEIVLVALRQLVVPQWDEAIRSGLAKDLCKKVTGHDGAASTATLDESGFAAIRVQLSAYRVVSITKQAANVPAGYLGLVWSQTPMGQRVHFEATIVRSSKNRSNALAAK
jgi:hypothetical protein